ncbi:MAG: outer membrane protein [Alphaproteobacteria bacterium]
MKSFLLVTTAVLGFATAGIAGAPDMGHDWSGYYAGGTYGSGAGGDMEYEGGGGTITYDSLEPGSSFGAFAGYNIQRDSLVYGGELAYSQVETPGFGPIGFPDETFNYFIDVKARVGYATNNMLAYGFAGYTSSAFAFSVDGDALSGGGLNYGVGVDMMVGTNMFVGVEYIARDIAIDTGGGQVQNTNINALQVRAGWNF